MLQNTCCYYFAFSARSTVLSARRTRSRAKFAAFVPALVLSLSASLTAQTTGSTAGISGIVREESGPAIPAVVLAVSGSVMRHTSSGPDGAFQFTQLPAGSYRLCAQVPQEKIRRGDDRFVDSCGLWESVPPPVTLAAGETRKGAVVTVARGYLLKIRVNDPGKLLPPPIGKNGGNALSLMIFGASGLPHNIPIVSQDAAGRDHAVVIPYGMPHKLSIQSSVLSLNDEIGRQIATTAPMDITLARGAALKTYVVNVVKAGKPWIPGIRTTCVGFVPWHGPDHARRPEYLWHFRSAAWEPHVERLVLGRSIEFHTNGHQRRLRCERTRDLYPAIQYNIPEPERGASNLGARRERGRISFPVGWIR